MVNETVGNKSSTLKHNLPLFLIVGIVVVVLVAGFIVLPRTEEGKVQLLERLGTSNQGVLLKPLVAIDQLALTDESGKPWVITEQAVKWRFLIPVASACDKGCRNALYLTRQVHVRMDKKSARVERVLLDLDGALDDETKELIAREHPYLKVINGHREEFAQLLADTNADWNSNHAQIFVVDQNGQAMMYFTAQHSGADLLSDLRHLLKYSPEP